MKKRIILASIINSLLVGGVMIAYANWTPPSWTPPPPTTPPNCPAGSPGCDAPINVGTAPQIKQGGLTVAATSLGVGFLVLNGNVGIGTASPGAKLDVQGTIRTGAAAGVSTPIELGGASPIGVGAVHYSYIDFHGDDTYTDYGLRVLRGNTGPDAISQLVHRGTGDFFLTALEPAAIKLRTANVDRVIIGASGNVGIGMTNPTTKLDVTGAIHSTADVCTDLVGGRCLSTVGGGGIGGSGTINSVAKFLGATTIGDSAITEVGGKVGIGTASPGTLLDIVGNNGANQLATLQLINLGAGAGTGNAIRFNTLLGGTNRVAQIRSYVTATGVGDLMFDTANANVYGNVMILKGNGNVGIGTASPTQKLEVNGNINATKVFNPVYAP